MTDLFLYGKLTFSELMLKVTFYTIGFSNLILSAFLYGGVNDQFITSEEVRELRKTTIEIEKSLARYREKMRLDREEIISQFN